MISGVGVTVMRPAVVGYDRLGNPVKETASEHVADVLVVPGATKDLEASRPDGALVAYTLHFPKGYEGSLEGCSVELPAHWAGVYRVIGAPAPYMDANTPTRWNMTVEVGAAHG